MKTEYRLKPGETCIGHRYFLQFKRTRTYLKKRWRIIAWLTGTKTEEYVTEEDWCYLPTESYSAVTGDHITIDDAPTKIDEYWSSTRYVKTQVDWPLEVRYVTSNFPDVEKYFEMLRRVRKSWLERKEAEKNAQTIYLK